MHRARLTMAIAIREPECDDEVQRTDRAKGKGVESQ
jgi:hypothetical protein